MSGADVTLEARGLEKRYRAVVALEDLSFTAAAGEVLGLLGPNGAGKTTAIRVLTTILPPTRGSFIAEYSRGMRQRLGIARSLVNDPRVVFFDEPTLGLDPAGQEQVLMLVRNIARERGVTVVLSTHFLAEVENVCSRVVILNRGRVVADGSVDEVTRRAAAPRRGRFRVPAEARERALAVLAGVAGISEVKPVEGRMKQRG